MDNGIVIRKIIGEKNAKGIIITPEEMNEALKYYTKEEIKTFFHSVLCKITTENLKSNKK